MNPRDHANALLEELCGRLALTPQELHPEEDMLALTVDGFMLLFAYAEETEELFSSAYIAETPKGPQKEALLRELLRGNYAWRGTDGGVLGLDGSIDYVTLSNAFYLPLTTAETFLESTARQIALAGEWRSVLAASGAAPETAKRA